MKTKLLSQLTAIVLVTASIMSAQATVMWSQDFETDTSGWSSGGSYGAINRVGSGGGTLGLTSADGSFHAEVSQTDYGPYSFFAGNSDVWPGPYTASIDIFLDTSWSSGSGFDYSVASSRSDGNHLRDFIFQVTMDSSTGGLLVAGSNNTNFDPKENLENGNHVEIVDSGWYTFEHQFYDIGGSLAVDLVLFSDTGTELFRETRNNTGDTIPGVVGGNRYAWFTNIDIDNGIGIDNHSLTVSSVPEPASLAMLMLGLTGLVYNRRLSHKSL